MGQNKHTQPLTYSWSSSTSTYAYMMLLSALLHSECSCFYVSKFMLSSHQLNDHQSVFTPYTDPVTWKHTNPQFSVEFQACAWVYTLCQGVCFCKVELLALERSFFFSWNLIWYDFIVHCKREGGVLGFGLRSPRQPKPDFIPPWGRPSGQAINLK